MEFTKLALYIENHGIGLVITILLIISIYKYFAPFMSECIETQKEMRKFMQNFNSDNIKGKGLEMILILKTQEFRHLFQKKIIQYIIENNLGKNWDVITKEIDLKVEDKEYEIYLELRDIVEKKVLDNYLEKLNAELAVAKRLIINLLNELKKDGENDKSLYDTAQRSVKIHFEHFENQMHNHIKKILN